MNKQQKAKAKGAKRQTLNKMIASASTIREKAEIALVGGKPKSELYHMIQMVGALESPCSFGEEWLANQIQGWKQRFADILFPAIFKNDIQAIEEVIHAMQDRRKFSAPSEVFLKAKRDKERGIIRKPSKKEIGRKLRAALLYMDPDDRLNIKTVRDALEKHGKGDSQFHSLFSDDSKIYAVMKELKLRFLQPGDIAIWRELVSKKIIRKLEILPDGTPKVTGLSRKNLASVNGIVVQRNFD